MNARPASPDLYLGPVVLQPLLGVYRPGVIVGVDVLFLSDVDPRQLKPVLNIVDWGSGYQALEPMREKTASEAFRKFWKAWGRHFGSPEVMVTDAGTEFGKEFCELAAGRGIITRQIGSRAPWQPSRRAVFGTRFAQRTRRSGRFGKPRLRKTGSTTGVDLLQLNGAWAKSSFPRLFDE